MATLTTVHQLVQRYDERYRHPGLPRLRVSDVYMLFPDDARDAALECAIRPLLRWPEPWPNCGAPGVYLVFGSNLELLYVGKASLSRGIAARLNDHFGYAKDGSRRCEPKGNWSKRPMYVAAVSVPHSFEAPALEEYLILELQPPENVLGRRATE